MLGPNYSQQLRVATDVGNVNLQFTPRFKLRTRQECVRALYPNATVAEWRELYNRSHHGQA